MRTSAAPKRLRIMTVDDSVFAREGLKAILKLDHGIKVVGEAETKARALEEVQRAKPDVVIMDMRLPDGTGADACQEILSAFPRMRILFFSAYNDDKALHTAIMAGGHGYLTKDTSAKDLLRAIRTIAAGRSLLGPTQTGRVLAWVKDQVAETPAITPAKLSPMDLTLLSMLADGATNKTIATALGKATNVITRLLSTLYKTLNVSRRTQAVRYFITQVGPHRSLPDAPAHPPVP